MWQPIGIAVLVVGVWFSIGLLTRRMSRWGLLARRYACRRAPAGRRFHLRSAELASMTFQSRLTLVPAAEGLYVRLTIPVVLGFPPLLVPWSDLEPAAPEASSNLVDATRLVIACDPPISLGLPRAVWNARPRR